ncbi:F0F1 ATP synthase subunit B [Candidatus Saccharibacteria bacterium]|nr:F0F1 ATP synthase subunit B [Candidatus Saccharibacteria bacterium]
MLPVYFAATETAEHASEGLPLGLSPQAFMIQLITFILIFFLLKRFAFEPIVKMLDKRHKVIEAGVKHGLEMEKEREKLEQETAKIVREARHDADAIISDAQKEGREMVREAEKTAHKKTENMLTDAEARINEEAEQARRKLEREIVGLVSEATEAVVEEKVDAKKDAALIDRAIKKGRKQ